MKIQRQLAFSLVCVLTVLAGSSQAAWYEGAYTAFGRWIGYGFGDGYHACPCPQACGHGPGAWGNGLTPAGHGGTSPYVLPGPAPCDGCARHPATSRKIHWTASRIPAAPAPLARPAAPAVRRAARATPRR